MPLFESSKQHEDKLARLLNRLGKAQIMRKHYDKGIAAYTRSLTINKKLNKIQAQAFTYMALGVVYKRIGLYDSAILNNQKTLELALRYNQKELIANQYNNIGYVYYKKKTTAKQKIFLLKVLQYTKKWGWQPKVFM